MEAVGYGDGSPIQRGDRTWRQALQRQGTSMRGKLARMLLMARIWILDEIIRLAKNLGDVWFATHAEVAAFCAKEGGLGS